MNLETFFGGDGVFKVSDTENLTLSQTTQNFRKCKCYYHIELRSPVTVITVTFSGTGAKLSSVI